MLEVTAVVTICGAGFAVVVVAVVVITVVTVAVAVDLAVDMAFAVVSLLGSCGCSCSCACSFGCDCVRAVIRTIARIAMIAQCIVMTMRPKRGCLCCVPCRYPYRTTAADEAEPLMLMKMMVIRAAGVEMCAKVSADGDHAAGLMMTRMSLMP